jgi:hypothetical protein
MGWWWRESKKANKTSKPPGIYEKGTKNGQFPHLLTLKNVENAVFYLKVLNKIYSKTFF